MPGSIVVGFAPSGRRSTVFFAATKGVGLPVPVLDGVHAVTASTTNSESATSFLM
jgi:hypothetical protein